jgi:undecaprenyl-diphosphatase
MVTFMRARFTPGEYLGLHLTIGVLVLVAATWLFGAIAGEVVSGHPLTSFDATVSAWLRAHASPKLTVAMLVVTGIHSTLGVLTIAAGVGLFLRRQRRKYALLVLTLTVPGGMLLNVVLKNVFQRARPSFDHTLLTFSGYSFPSGHTMAATMLYGTLAALALASLRGWHWRFLVVVVATFLIMLVGFSRIYLGAHYLSDVLGAMVEGMAWLAFCLTAVDTLRRRKRL